MKLVATRKEQQNQAVLDPWAVIHFAAGLAFGLMEVSFRRAALASLVYEIAEQYFERKPWGMRFFKTSGPESLGNALMDMVVLALGHRLGAAWNATGEAREIRA